MLAIVAVVCFSAGFSFLCSLMEAALYAVPPSRVQSMVDSGVKGAALLAKLREKIDIPISAILTFNTIANTVGATILGVLAGKTFGADSIYTLLVLPVIFTLIILIISEIIPKTLGVIYADVIAPKSAYVIEILIIVLYPFVRMSMYVTGRIRVAGAEKKTVSEEDLIAQARMGAEEGSLYPEEARWVEHALRLNEKTAHELMTPRTVVYTLPQELPLTEVTSKSAHWAHSRLPVCEDGNPDKIRGVVYRREVFDTILTRNDEDLAKMTIGDLRRDVDMIPETLRGHEILKRFLESRQHLFVVTNEHGGLEGVITLEDVIEDLLGQEIIDFHDQHEDMQQYALKLAERRRRFLDSHAPPEAGNEEE